MLTLSRLACGYGSIQVLKGISLNIDKQEIVSLIGANGAGKSTTLKAITGLLKPVSGKMEFEQDDLSNKKPHEIVKMGISHVPEGRRIFPLLTVQENLELGGFLLRHTPQGRQLMDRVFQLFPVLSERKNQMGMTLSGGEQQMLAVARGMMSNPRLLILDEPSLGLAPLFVEKIVGFIREINQEGMTVFLVEQNVHVALGICHRAYVMEMGEIVLQGSGEELLRDPDVKKRYLGEA
jgi:branched-chain amino acid transport system ATP-binding protein